MPSTRRWRSLLLVLVLLHEAFGATASLGREQVRVDVNVPDEIYIRDSTLDPRRVCEDGSYYGIYRRFLQGKSTGQAASGPSSKRNLRSNGRRCRDLGHAKPIFQLHSMMIARQDPTSLGHRNRQWGRRRHLHKRRLSHSDEWERRDNNPSNSIVGGIPGTIDIVSPTADNPVGVKLAALLISTEASELNQFELTASDADASTIYLVVRGGTPLADGSLTVGLEVPVLDASKMSYIPYCATFDTSKASPLTAMECLRGQGISVNSSQLFAYNPANGVIKPLWVESTLLNEASRTNSVEPSAASAAAGRIPQIVTSLHSTDKDNLSTPQTRSVSLVFTPELNPTMPVVHNRVTKTVSPLVASSMLPSSEASAPGRSITVAPTSTIIEAPTTSLVPSEIAQSVIGDGESSVASSQFINDAEGEAPSSTPGASAATAATTTSTSPSSYSAPVASSPPTKKQRCTEWAGSKNCETTPGMAVDALSSQTGENGFENYDASTLTPVDTGYAWKFSPLENTQS